MKRNELSGIVCKNVWSEKLSSDLEQNLHWFQKMQDLILNIMYFQPTKAMVFLRPGFHSLWSWHARWSDSQHCEAGVTGTNKGVVGMVKLHRHLNRDLVSWAFAAAILAMLLYKRDLFCPLGEYQLGRTQRNLTSYCQKRQGDEEVYTPVHARCQSHGPSSDPTGENFTQD